jgi:hypothetical protein
VGQHASALLTDAFTPRPILQALAAEAVHVPVVANGPETIPALFALSNGPPDLLVLRI